MPYREGCNERHQISIGFDDNLNLNYVIPNLYKEGVFIMQFICTATLQIQKKTKLSISKFMTIYTWQQL